MRKRAVIINTAIIFGFVIIMLRLMDIMLLKHGQFYERAKTQQVKQEEIQVRRGILFDRQGRELAVNLELESVYCDPFTMVYPEKTAYELSMITGRPEKAILTKLSSDSRFVWLEKKIEPELAARVRAMKTSGIYLIPDAKRFYPKGSLASHILGFVDTDNRGIEGVELKYNDQLNRSSRKVSFERDASGRKMSRGVEMEARGNNLVLTIDEGLQYMVESELDNAISRWRAAAAAAIMMDPYTGEILALANRPTFDPNHPAKNKDYERRNRAITDSYEPGSTFKIIIGTAALEEKAVRLDTKFDCSRGAVEVGGRLMRDVHKHGLLTFKEVIQKSSNVGSIMVGQRLGKEKVYKYAKLFGFGEKSGIDLPGEVSGRIRPPERWSGMSIGAVSIGQEVAVTPLQVLRAYSAIANGGLLVKPHIVSRVISPEGKQIWSTMPEYKRVISQATSEIFRDILKTVTEEGGTAQTAAVSGNLVAGKTGTAQIIDPRTKKYSKEKFVSSFVGFVPADRPKIALIVIVYEPKGQIYGGVVAGPVFKKISESALSYMSVPRDDSIGKILVVSK